MKKKLLLLIVFCGAIVANAQFNYSYYPTSGPTIFPHDFYNSVSMGDGEDGQLLYWTSSSKDDVNNIENTVVAKSTLNGTILKAVTIDGVYSCKKVKWQKTGLLFIGMSASPGWELIFFDDNLNILWQKKVALSNWGTAAIWSRMEVEGLEDADGNYNMYVVLGSCRTFYTPYPYSNEDAAFAVMKIGLDGTTKWCKRYADANRLTGPEYMVSDFATGIAIAKDGETGKSRIAICGGRDEYIASTYTFDYYMFAMYIDEDGNPTSPYTKILPNTPFIIYHPSMIWDENQNRFVMTYIHPNDLTPDPNNVSGIGLITLDPYFTPTNGMYYYDDYENYGYKIKQSTDGNYVISGITTSQNPDIITKPCILKVDAQTLSPLTFKKYNVHESMSMSLDGHVLDVNDNIYFPSSKYFGTSSYFNTARIIRTDPNGEVCGAMEYIPTVINFNPTSSTLNYISGDIPVTELYKTATEIYLDYYDCEWAPDAFKNATGAAAIANAPAFSLYPTVAQSSDKLTLSYNSAKQDVLHVWSTNILGVSTPSITVNVNAGDNRQILNDLKLMPGVQFIHVQSTGGFNKVVKIIQQ